jgi:thiamine-phosphate pyrophosphorylase
MAIDYTLYLVADTGSAAGRDLPELVDAAVDGGVTVVQLRAKDLPKTDILALAGEISRRLRPREIPLLVNDHPDVAKACGAAGVHLGQGDAAVSEARRLLGREATIGVSVNTPDEARRAERDSADYVGAGPAYATTTKRTDLAILGPEGIGRIVQATALPVVAIGGIGAGNAAEAAAAGARGVAVVSAILGAPDARRAARDLIEAFKRSRQRP